MKQYENMKHGTEEFPVGIHDTLCENGFSLYPHIHREFEFLVMTRGRGILYIGEEKFELTEGEGVFINSEQLHIGIKTDSNLAEFFAVVFAPEIFGSRSDRVVSKYVKPVEEGIITPKPRLSPAALEALKKIHRMKEDGNELLIKAGLCTVWDECIKTAEYKKLPQSSKAVDEIKKAMEYIRSEYNQPVTLDDIATFLNISKGYLCRQFSQIVHMTPFEYLAEVRIDKSCDLIKTTTLPIGEIAQMCGFNSFSYFSKVFRQKTGCTPREYRLK